MYQLLHANGSALVTERTGLEPKTRHPEWTHKLEFRFSVQVQRFTYREVFPRKCMIKLGFIHFFSSDYPSSTPLIKGCQSGLAESLAINLWVLEQVNIYFSRDSGSLHCTVFEIS